MNFIEELGVFGAVPVRKKEEKFLTSKGGIHYISKSSRDTFIAKTHWSKLTEQHHKGVADIKDHHLVMHL